MVDCGASKCLQERKNFKKELLSWTKKIPILIGLEEVSKVVLGRRLSRKILEVTHCGTKKNSIEDWEPQENCTFCDRKSKFYVGENSHNKVENNFHVKETITALYPNVSNGHKQISSSTPAYVNEIPKPMLTPSMMTTDLDQPLDLTMPSRTSDQMVTASPPSKPAIQLKVPSLEGKFPSKKREGSNGQKKVYTEEELAAAVSDIRSGKIGTRRAAALYGIPRSTLRNKMCRLDMIDANNSSPSQPSIQAPKLTVRDLLQSGNGVTYKDENSLDEKPLMDEDDKLSNIRQKHDLNAGVKRPFGMPPLFYNSQYMMECERAFQLANPYAYDMKLPYLQDLIWRYAQERVDLGSDYAKEKDLPGYNRNDISTTPEMTALDLQIPTLPSSSEHYVRSLNSSPLRASETQDAESPPSAQGFITSHISDTLKDVISKTISEKVMKDRHHMKVLPSPNEPQSSRPSSCDQLLSPSQPVFPNPYEGFYLPPNNGICYTNGKKNSYDDPSPPKKHKFEPKQVIPSPERGLSVPKKIFENIPIAPKPTEGSNSSDDKTPAKKTRPKRGQYRKYNHELLMEAVRAVQRGEMSVHRAGSYYGVPHSTLEYKVKERHLLRQKKPREPRKKNGSGNGSNNESTNKTQHQGTTNGTGAPSTPTNHNVSDLNSHSKEPGHEDITKNDDNKEEALSSELEAAQSLQASLLMGSLGAAGALPSFPLSSQFPMGFGWPPLLNGNLPFPLPDAALAASIYSASGLGINTSASELLKKLQQKVQLETGNEDSSHKECSNEDDVKDNISGDKNKENCVQNGDDCNDQVKIESADSANLIDVVDK